MKVQKNVIFVTEKAGTFVIRVSAQGLFLRIHPKPHFYLWIPPVCLVPNVTVKVLYPVAVPLDTRKYQFNNSSKKPNY